MRALEFGDAQKVPRRVLDVVGIGATVQLELLAAVSEPLGVIERQPALPQFGLRCRDGQNKLIEDAGGFDGFRFKEQPDSVGEQLLGRGFCCAVSSEKGEHEPREDGPGVVHARLAEIAVRHLGTDDIF